MTGSCAAFLLFWRALPGNDSRSLSESPKRSTYFGNLFDLEKSRTIFVNSMRDLFTKRCQRRLSRRFFRQCTMPIGTGFRFSQKGLNESRISIINWAGQTIFGWVRASSPRTTCFASTICEIDRLRSNGTTTDYIYCTKSEAGLAAPSRNWRFWKARAKRPYVNHTGRASNAPKSPIPRRRR